MQHERQQVPVTALAFWNDDILLTGEGSLLRGYNIATGSLLLSVQLFDHQAIHGIVAGPENADLFLIWGGRFIRHVVLTVREDGGIATKTEDVQQAEDWILDACFCPVNLAKRITATCITAHNALISISGQENETHQTLSPLIIGSNCILYSAHIKWVSHCKCLIASGTAFGDVIVWSCDVFQDRDAITVRSKNHYVFSAHEGSVFGMQIAPLDIAQAMGGRDYVLASCSDDRTIKFWDISDLTVESPPFDEIQRQTGFGSKPASNARTPPCLARVMAHSSRIWHVRFVMGKTSADGLICGNVRLLSFGEDASYIVWGFKQAHGAEDSPLYSLEKLGVQRTHAGKHIWSVATRHGRIATGGADGAANLSSLECSSNTSNITEVGSNSLGNVSGKDNFRTYAFVSSREVLSTTDSGRLVLLVLQSSAPLILEHIKDAIPGLSGYSVIVGCPGFAFIGGNDGVVYAYIHQSKSVFELFRSRGKVASLQIREAKASGETTRPGDIGLLVTNVGSAIASCIILAYSSGSESLSVHNQWQLSLPENFIVTSFACLRSEATLDVILGSRNGSLAMWTLPYENSDAITHTATKLHPSVHEDESITSLRFVTTGADSESLCALFSTGRDGTYALHVMASEGSEIVLRIVHQLSLPFGPNIEGLALVDESRIWVWGFRGKCFVVFDIISQQEIKSIECGGAHRNWAFDPLPDGGVFIWTKASHVYYELLQDFSDTKLINSGGHGREIKSMAISPGDSNLIATGAEDTDIKLSVPRRDGFRYLHTLRKHNTGIQHLQWSSTGGYLLSSGGFEEFFIWKVQFKVPRLQIGVLCESAHPRSGKSDLRIMNFLAKKTDTDGEFIITMLYSDSVVKIWRYLHREWTILSQGNYLTSCLTQCFELGDGGETLVTGSTDGHLVLWPSPSGASIDWTTRYQVHQNSILSMVACRLKNEGNVIISGGDDNAISLTHLSSSGVLANLVLPRAHAAAVTALAILALNENYVIFASSSIDQRVKLWQAQVDSSSPSSPPVISVKLVAACPTAVADVCGLGLLQYPDAGFGLLVSGVGLDEWKLSKSLLQTPSARCGKGLDDRKTSCSSLA